jgi:hypothetical protein
MNRDERPGSRVRRDERSSDSGPSELPPAQQLETADGVLLDTADGQDLMEAR